LRRQDFIFFTERLVKKIPEPIFAKRCSGEIQFVKNGKFFFGVEDGYIIKGRFIY
jgi:hypothetical protein